MPTPSSLLRYTAPEVVRQALIVHASVEKVVVGGEKTYNSINTKDLFKFLSNPDPTLGQTGLQGFTVCCNSSKKQSFKYIVTVSRYSKKLANRQDDVLPANFLGGGISPSQIEAEESSLQNLHEQMNEFRPKMDDAEREREETQQKTQQCHASFETAKKRKESVKNFIVKYEKSKKTLQEKQAALNEDNDEGEKKEYIQQLMNRVMHSITAIESHSSQQEKMLNAVVSATGSGANKASITAAERTAA